MPINEEDQHQSLKKTPRVETFGRQKNRKNCVSRRSESRKMNLYKDKFDAVKRNPYSISCTYWLNVLFVCTSFIY